jgi:hypothetical protein
LLTYIVELAVQNGEIHFMLQRVEEWGSLKDFRNYLRFASFLLNHRRWFRDNVWRVIEDRTASDRYWFEGKLERAKGLQPYGMSPRLLFKRSNPIQPDHSIHPHSSDPPLFSIRSERKNPIVPRDALNGRENVGVLALAWTRVQGMIIATVRSLINKLFS